MGDSPDSTTTGDSIDIDTVFLLIGTLFTLGRLWMDVFILTINCRDWVKNQHLSPSDTILMLQGSGRVCFGSTMVIRLFLIKFCPWVAQIGYVHKALLFSFSYFPSCNAWLTASLCSYYCVKIADFSHPFFIRLKLRLSSGLVSTWLLGSALLSLASSLPLVGSGLERQSDRNFSQVSQNKKVPMSSSYATTSSVQHALEGLGHSAAFGICAISAGLLLFSLRRHRQRMLGSWGGRGSPQTEAHFRAVVAILSLLLNHVVVFISIQLLFWEGNQGARIGASVGLCGGLLLEPLISIWGNKKLRNELRGSLRFAKCRGCVS